MGYSGKSFSVALGSRHFKMPPFLVLIGFAIAGVWVAVAVAAPLISPHDPIAQNWDPLQPPSAQNILGTDELGRDVLSRVLWGARSSIPYAVLIVSIALTIGTVVGVIAGYFGGWIDELIMRVVDVVFAFPTIILAMAITAALGPGLRNTVLAVVVVSWPGYSRVARSLVLTAMKSEYVAAAKLLGASSARVLIRDVLPNVVGPQVVLATLGVSDAILLLAGLSFLGLGAQPPAPDWGSMISIGAQYFDRWWLSAFPGMAIFSIVFAFNVLGDSVRDAFDPRLTLRR
ncbi:MAG: ABC transporter permease [Aggregatilineales bacterium]